MVPWITNIVFDMFENLSSVIQNVNNFSSIDDNLVVVMISTVSVLNLLNGDFTDLVAMK